MPYPLSARLTDDELEAIRAVWSAASGKKWRVETFDNYTKLYAVCPPHMHDLYLMDLSAFDANGAANVAAIAAAPKHIERLLSAYETLRDHVDDVQRDWEEALVEAGDAERARLLTESAEHTAKAVEAERERLLKEFEAEASRLEAEIEALGSLAPHTMAALKHTATLLRALIARLRSAVRT